MDHQAALILNIGMIKKKKIKKFYLGVKETNRFVPPEFIR